MISAFFRLLGKFSLYKHLLMSGDKTIETTSAFSFNTFGGIFSFWYALDESRLQISFCISNMDIGLKLNVACIKPCSCILIMLGWYLYFSIASLAGSVINILGMQFSVNI